MNHITPKKLKFAYNRLKKEIRRRECNPLLPDEEFIPYGEDWLLNFIECNCFDLYEGAIQMHEIFNHLLENFRNQFEIDITPRCIITL